MFQFYLFRMKIHYIILVHKNPEQLCRLVEQLETEQTDFYIHVDRKTDISPFQEKLSRPNVCFISERVDILWGTISQVSAVLNCMREISRKGEEACYFVKRAGLSVEIESLYCCVFGNASDN